VTGSDHTDFNYQMIITGSQCLNVGQQLIVAGLETIPGIRRKTDMGAKLVATCCQLICRPQRLDHRDELLISG
jgi:hypothetical protein